MAKPSTFEQQKIDWLQALLAGWYVPTNLRPLPDFLPCRVRLKTDVKHWKNGTDWGTVASAGTEVDVEATVHGMPKFVLDEGNDGIWLNPCELEVLAFAPNAKKQMMKRETEREKVQ